MQHTKEEILKDIYLFSNFTEDELSAIAEKTEYKVYEQGDAIFHEGNDAKAFFVVIYGTLKVLTSTEKGDDVNVTTIATGDHFGELPFLDPGKRSASVEAMERSELLRIPYDHLKTVFEKDSKASLKFYQAISHFLAKRLRMLTHDLTYARELRKRYTI
ncbi:MULTISPECIES: cyclic nucleotide-binding domain-containing protein [Leptospira]|uniref:Cyclic nucleotide-binding domain protein n=7 Tax=Leptospira TaxID=171 RepID=M3GCP4_9LEPT|nr:MULTISPECIES: cyclic nucleotide-binding domain-containing protein [Leptospira]EMF83674.1 cyclic nucleotide-binding domain protein [Leptospira weilii serovar Topaz str. LT2116]EMM73723.1 cyclic nucleotide-binding domain protein [Leptospira weilii str. 2006001855]EMY13379.1 cyclic nucleotide-binding domain protein [Leptospira weilii str. Ecochallenge]AXR61080.1 cyclic nucleotide-binding domain-containing protein [Leptospira mayottensis]AXR65664.1 cyclic nucleotide-binding domain-containing pr